MVEFGGLGEDKVSQTVEGGRVLIYRSLRVALLSWEWQSEVYLWSSLKELRTDQPIPCPVPRQCRLDDPALCADAPHHGTQNSQSWSSGRTCFFVLVQPLSCYRYSQRSAPPNLDLSARELVLLTTSSRSQHMQHPRYLDMNDRLS